MASRIFEGYTEEHAEICAGVGRIIAQLRSETDFESRKAKQKSAESELSRAEDLVQQMDLEARSAPKADARALQARAKTCRAEVGTLRTSLKEAVYAVPRGTTPGGLSDGDDAESNDQNARLLRMGTKMEEGTSKLQQAHRTVLETEAIGISILGDLRMQRETITHAAGTLQRANEGLARSKRTLAAIGRRALANRVIMWLLIVLLGGGILILAYLQLFGVGGEHKGSEQENTCTGPSCSALKNENQR
jgi:vesicle transport through interaction with t-SNAREs protein 1